MLLFDLYICYWQFHETAISKHFKILNTFLFRFSTIMNKFKYGYYVIYRSTDKTKYRSFQVQWLLNVLFTKIRNNTSLTKNYNFLISALYVWRLFWFQLFNYTSAFKFQPNDKQKGPTQKSVRANEIFLLQVESFQYKQAYFPFSCPFW